MWRLRFCTLFAVIFLVLPLSVHAVSVGFLPTTPLWYSPTMFTPGDIISVYTVVVNNEYPSLSGTVGFYANNVEMNRATFQNLKKDEAKELKVFWQPTSGQYTLSAKFISATVTDSHGVSQTLHPDDISTTLATFGDQSAPLSSGAADTASSTNTSQSTPAGVSNEISITNDGGQLIIQPKTNNGSLIDTFANGKQKLDSAMQFVTSSANVIVSTYEKTKAAVDTGHAYYTKAAGWWQRAQPYLRGVRHGLQVITNDYEPRRMMYIAIAGILLWIIFKIIRRQRTFDDYRR